jgi:hypothetical protein
MVNVTSHPVRVLNPIEDAEAQQWLPVKLEEPKGETTPR